MKTDQRKALSEKQGSKSKKVTKNSGSRTDVERKVERGEIGLKINLMGINRKERSLMYCI